MRIYIMRHGETDWNKQGRWQGTMDVPLNGAGIEQARRIAEKLAELDIGCIYTSPLSRAYETAKLIGEKAGLSIVVDEGLKEIDMGGWAGQTLAEMKDNYGRLFDEWNENDAAQVGYGVESYGCLKERALMSLEGICARESKTVLIVAHGTWMRALMCGLLHIPLSKRNCFEISNAGICVLDYDRCGKSFKVLSVNITGDALWRNQ